MATAHPYPNPTDDPDFYCHGQACLDHGCNPLRCKDQDGEPRGEHLGDYPDMSGWDGWG